MHSDELDISVGIIGVYFLLCASRKGRSGERREYERRFNRMRLEFSSICEGTRDLIAWIFRALNGAPTKFIYTTSLYLVLFL